MNFLSTQTALVTSAILLYFVQITLGGSVTLVNNAYKDVVVAISQDLTADTSLGATIIDMFQRTSEVLYNATGNRAYFGNIIIVGSSSFLKSGGLRAKRGTSNQWEPPIPSFDSADVRIDIPNDAYGDVPYTQQSRGCGEPGDFIHLTSSFVHRTTSSFAIDEPTQAKLLANEWMKYRYGVFDENGYNWNDFYPVMYYGTTGQSEYNMCSNNTKITWATETCTDNSQIEGLSEACTLTPDTTSGANVNVNSSMMSYPLLQLATKYCTSSSDHNSDAPNKQNFNCKGKSIMEVVLQHSDFAGGANGPSGQDFGSFQTLSVTNSTSNENIALIVVSDPMVHNETTYSITPSLQKFVMLDLPAGSNFGIVQNIVNTSDVNEIVINFQNITVNTNRSNLADSIFNFIVDSESSYVRDSITACVNSAVTTLNSAPDNQFNKAILLLSDQVSDTELTSICQTTEANKIQIHLVTFNANVFTSFNNNPDCIGQAYLIQAETPSGGLNEVQQCYADVQRRAQMESAMMNLPSTILPDKFTRPSVFFQEMYTNSVINSTINVDAQVTQGTSIFYVETCLNGIYNTDNKRKRLLNCSIETNTNLNYNFYSQIFTDSGYTITSRRNYTFSVINLQAATNGPVPFVVYAVGSPTRGAAQSTLIKTEAWVVTEDMESNKWTKVRIFASVKNGTTPVFDASVQARIISEGNINSNYTMNLMDDGSGNPDISAQDGIYSAYITQFGASAQYSVVVTITDNEGAATYPTNPYPWISNINDMGERTATSFQRTVQTNAFTAKGSSSDIPPGTVNDFRLKSINGPSITLTWTAPGDDLDHGNAYRYAFNCNINKTYLENLVKLDQSGAVIDSNLPSDSITPKEAGETETTSFDGHFDQTVHYCTFQAVDASGRYGNKSNIVSYYLISDTTGLSSASIAGIVVGVILGIILLIAIIVLIWYCLAGRDDNKEKKHDLEDTEDQAASKLRPIMVQPPIAVDQRSNAYTVENVQNNRPPSRPISLQSLAHSHQSGYDGNGSDDDDGRSNYSKHTGGMHTFQQGKPIGIPVLPTENFPMHPIGGGHYGSPGLHDPGEQFDSTYLMANADVAVPQRLAKLATIEDVGEYHDKNILKGTPGARDDMREYTNMPVYNHLLNKQQAPLPPPRSASSSQSSLSNIENPKNISQV